MTATTEPSTADLVVPNHGANSESRMGDLLSDLEDCVHDHCSHGPLTADATEPAWNGDLLTVACQCGVVFGRWVTPEDAELDLLRMARLS